MRFLRRWLRVERPPGIALHATKTVELALSPEQAYQRSVEGIERVLGGIIREHDRSRGTIEAAFGLINSERLTVTVSRAEHGTSRVVIESRRGVSPQSTSSQYVDALARFLTSPPVH